jgi:hypothetical protein
VKAAEQHETKVIGGSIFDQALRQVQVGKAAPALSVNAVKLHIERWVPTAQIFGAAPIEERAECEHVTFGRARSDKSLRRVANALHWNFLHDFGEHFGLDFKRKTLDLDHESLGGFRR